MCDNKKTSEPPVVEINTAERKVFNLESKAIRPYDVSLMTKPSNAQPTNNNSNNENGGD